MSAPAEFDLIARIRARAGGRDDVVLGIGDDAALLAPPPGRQLVVAMDMLNEGVHFPQGTTPADLGWKALAVNLSDLAAMGAEPAWCTLALSLPCADAAWIDAFLDGFCGLAARHGVALVGGDTTRGPLSACVTVHGFVAPGTALRRDAARIGDDVWVSGTLGDAAAALSRLSADDAPPGSEAAHASAALRTRLDRPTPRVELGRALVGIARACIDVSDGLLADLGHVCRASGVGARLDLATLPASIALRALFDAGLRAPLQCAGGDDYELCFTALETARGEVLHAAQTARTPVTRIGRVVEDQGVVVVDASGTPWQPPRIGYVHFD